jgi:hypothetical protein
VFKTNKVIENVWIGLKNSNNQFKWTDGSEIGFTNWAKGNPRNKTDHNCVQMMADSSPIGQWSDDLCNKKHVIVCEKAPTVTITFLQKKFLELRKKLSETQNTLSTYLKFLTNDKWINFKLFTDSDGKHKALFLYISKTDPFIRWATWGVAKRTCESLNASLVEIQTKEKQFILESFLGQFGIESNKLHKIWLNGHRESSGKWRWITSGKQITYTNWADSQPEAKIGYDYITIKSNEYKFGEWYSDEFFAHVVCEIEVHF